MEKNHFWKYKNRKTDIYKDERYSDYGGASSRHFGGVGLPARPIMAEEGPLEESLWVYYTVTIRQ